VADSPAYFFQGAIVKFVPTRLSGACIIDIEPLSDERGFFARTFCRDEFAAHGLRIDFPQCNTSYNSQRGTLRGMHFQREPYAEAKLVRCTRGAIYDVIVDLRPESPSLCRWMAVELTAENHRMLYVPEGFAHGFQTLADDSEVFYQMGAMYRSDAAAGVRWNDPAFEIHWPLPDPVISSRDAGYGDFVPHRLK
jgi:dTDP-4-dehydrorhamnose 3,5-epimerase